MPATKSAKAFWLGTVQSKSNLAMISCRWFARLILYANYLVILSMAILWIKPLSEMLVNKNIGDGFLRLVALQLNLQMYWNKALLSWYQRLHASKVPNLEFSRAKFFLHNHFLCPVVLYFFAPPVLLLVFLRLSQLDGNSVEDYQLGCGLLPCSAFLKVALFLAWWVVYTSVTLLLFRRGNLYVS
ncbi:hypothetical protein FEM48_Zijuj11G0094600 [Ziziphus jujuba var. spinosa]|uniref:Uncharacterized protein n=1 Tax=Ziziphus jujuba var. spinosa TaxID=714518 RepID=A0A978UI55_ZIZJJ|nr:hypothetical protein FEM48_Zijuj11G0094600 [Ziziphus jujuba var. spinosa]